MVKFSNLIKFEFYPDWNQTPYKSSSLETFRNLEDSINKFTSFVEKITLQDTEEYFKFFFAITHLEKNYKLDVPKRISRYTLMIFPSENEINYEIKKGPFYVNKSLDPISIWEPINNEIYTTRTYLLFSKNPFDNPQDYSKFLHLFRKELRKKFK